MTLCSRSESTDFDGPLIFNGLAPVTLLWLVSSPELTQSHSKPTFQHNSTVVRPQEIELWVQKMHCLYYVMLPIKKCVGIVTEKQKGGEGRAKEGVCSRKQRCLCVSGVEGSKGTEKGPHIKVVFE